MLPFIIRRLLWMVVLLLIISFLTFLIFYTLPSADPAVLRAGRQPTPELVATIRETLGLDKPWYVQYGKYLERLVILSIVVQLVGTLVILFRTQERGGHLQQASSS